MKLEWRVCMWKREMGSLTLTVTDSGPPHLLHEALPARAVKTLEATRFHWSVQGTNAELSGTASSKEQATQDCDEASEFFVQSENRGEP